MVRTKAEATVTKVAAAKAPRKVFNASGAASSSSSSTTPSKASKYGGGNSYKPQPVPDWQKGIGSFFKTDQDHRRQNGVEAEQGGSGGSRKRLEMEEGEGSGVCGMEEGEGSGISRLSPSPSPPPKNGIISDDDDDD